jgi:hypothetical protein
MELALMLSTGLFTALAVIVWRFTCNESDEVKRVAHNLRKQAAQHELLLEEIEALNRRHAKLAGRYYRQRREEPDTDPAEDHPPEPVAPELQAMLDLQKAYGGSGGS